MRRPRFFLNSILGMVIAAAACSNEQATPLEPQVPVASAFKLQGGSGISVLIPQCDPLPAQTVSQSIGRDGGVLQIGPHTLVVPARALTKPVTITARIESDGINSVLFAPAGLTFKQPAALVMSYANCKLDTELRKQMRVVYTDDYLASVLSVLPSVDVQAKKTVNTTLNHFSRYAVAY